jgi:hypothetical protein
MEREWNIEEGSVSSVPRIATRLSRTIDPVFEVMAIDVVGSRRRVAAKVEVLENQFRAHPNGGRN